MYWPHAHILGVFVLYLAGTYDNTINYCAVVYCTPTRVLYYCYTTAILLLYYCSIIVFSILPSTTTSTRLPTSYLENKPNILPIFSLFISLASNQIDGWLSRDS